MAGRLQKVLFGFSAIITIVSVYWLRKRRKCISQSTPPSTPCPLSNDLQDLPISPKTPTRTEPAGVFSSPQEPLASVDAPDMKPRDAVINQLESMPAPAIVSPEKMSNAITSGDKIVSPGELVIADSPKAGKNKIVKSNMLREASIKDEQTPEPQVPISNGDKKSKIIPSDAQENRTNDKRNGDLKKPISILPLSVQSDTPVSSVDDFPSKVVESKFAVKTVTNLDVDSSATGKILEDRESLDYFQESPCPNKTRQSSIVEGDKAGEDISANLHYSDNRSENSSDSGIQGGSDGCVESPVALLVDENPFIIYQFELPADYCGKLIGRGGHYVHQIKLESNANIIVNNHPYTADIKICSVEGFRHDVRLALQMIRKRFPSSAYPDVTLQQINAINPLEGMNCAVPLPRSCQLPLAAGDSCDVILSSLVNAGHFFLQQPTHNTYPSLHQLDQIMTMSYTTVATPPVPNPSPGMIVATPIMSGWYRAMIVDVFENDECEVKFVDYGGFSRLPVASLRQIRVDFMTLPFQASECYLANVKPAKEEGWSREANAFFEEIAQGQMLQAVVTDYTSEGISVVQLYKVQGASNFDINEELVKRGHAHWTD